MNTRHPYPPRLTAGELLLIVFLCCLSASVAVSLFVYFPV